MKQSKITLSPKRIFIFKSSKKNAYLESETTTGTHTIVTTSGIAFKN